MKIKRCAESPAQREYSLCGMAFDSPDTEDDVDPFVFAKPGQKITCEECLRVIRIIHAEFTILGNVRKSTKD